jgi:endo-1,4-beta-xylanase
MAHGLRFGQHETGWDVGRSEREINMDRHASRRGFVWGLCAGAIASALPLRGSTAAGPRSLKEIAAEKGILFGSSVGGGRAGTLTGSFADARYLDILERDCSVLVPENELKSYVIAIQRGRYDFEPGDRIASFARNNGIKLRGHTLLWNRTEFTPKWLLDSFGALTAQAGEQYLQEYIRQVCTHYGEQIHSWDVVNETIDPKTGQVRETPFSRVLDFDLFRIAYEAAREHAPRAQLVYNDYMSWETGNERHRTGVLKLLERFRNDRIPVDALGIQSHLGNNRDINSAQHKEWRAFIDEVVGMGYRLLITEFDVNDKDLPTEIRKRDAAVAAVAREYLDLMLSYRQLDQLLCWGMVDKYSWLQNFSPRQDKQPQRPNPYSETYERKSLWDAIAAALASAGAR